MLDGFAKIYARKLYLKFFSGFRVVEGIGEIKKLKLFSEN